MKFERPAQQTVDDPCSFTHRFADVNGIRIHFVEQGTGPLLVLLHGFPYLWYMWRRQIRALAAAGYRVVAPDIRGFGQTAGPAEPEQYHVLNCVGDVVGLVRVLGERRAVVIGHDLGAWVAYGCAQLRPDLFPALALLNTPAWPREARRPSDGWKAWEASTGMRFYQHYFQAQADAEMNADLRRTLRSVFYSISGDARGIERWRLGIAPGETFLDTVTDPAQFPAWLHPVGIDYYVSEYARQGFSAPLNHYRARDRSWELTPFLDGLVLQQPALFIGGAADPALERFLPYFDTMESHLPKLRNKVLLDGVGHSAAEEQPGVVSCMLLEFLASLPASIESA